jgi:hypothetical protein
LGILEFLLDAVSFNPNDEFGRDSLYLCSPIETSFGYTEKYEAKLLNYKDLLSAHELETILYDQYCSYDSDCEYTPSCISKCDLKTHKCSFYLAEPQVVTLCRFMKTYLVDDADNNTKNMDKLNQVMSKCLGLSRIRRSTINNYFSSIANHFDKKTDDASGEVNLLLDPQYAYDYSSISDQLKRSLWSFIKFKRDPEKPKRTQKLTTAPVK